MEDHPAGGLTSGWEQLGPHCPRIAEAWHTVGVQDGICGLDPPSHFTGGKLRPSGVEPVNRFWGGCSLLLTAAGLCEG